VQAAGMGALAAARVPTPCKSPVANSRCPWVPTTGCMGQRSRCGTTEQLEIASKQLLPLRGQRPQTFLHVAPGQRNARWRCPQQGLSGAHATSATPTSTNKNKQPVAPIALLWVGH
jgi:hypothetical protein